MSFLSRILPIQHIFRHVQFFAKEKDIFVYLNTSQLKLLLLIFRSLLGGPAAGALLARGHGTYNFMILFCGSTMIFGSFFILAAKLVQGRILARV